MRKPKKTVKSMCFGAVLLITAAPGVKSAVVVDESDPQFHQLVVQELTLMREGKRGLVCQELVNRIDASAATTTIRPVTADESTWHPNDPRGVRSHVLPLDTKVRHAVRNVPTSTVLYLHPNRIDPKLSVFRLGTFARELSIAMDFNTGQFSPDYKAREKRTVFFRNAWCDAVGCPMIAISDRIPTTEYMEAKKRGLLTPENAALFPILDLDSLAPVPESAN